MQKEKQREGRKTAFSALGTNCDCVHYVRALPAASRQLVMVANTGALFCLLFILNEARLAALYTSVYNAAIKVDDEIQNKTL